MRLRHRLFLAVGGGLLWFNALTGQIDATWQPDSLTVAAIMRDPAWMGHSPDDIRWSLDGKTLYFTWNPHPTPGDSLYALPAKGGTPTPVPPAQRETLPPTEVVRSPQGDRLAYVHHGDLYVAPTDGKGSPRRLTRTLTRERTPHFDQSGERLFFEAHDDLFALQLSTGELTQLTDLRPGKPASEATTLAEQRGWLTRQERTLIQHVAEQAEQRQPETPVPGHPSAYYYGEGSLQALRLSPDGRYATFRVRQRNSSDQTRVPNYIRADGYVATRSARPKVGSEQSTYQFHVYDLVRDSGYVLETAQLPGIDQAPAYLEEYQVSTRSQELQPVGEPREVMVMGPNWSDDGQHAVVEIRSLDFKDRWLMRLAPETGELTLLDRQRDEAWIGGPGIPRWLGRPGDQGWLPDNRTFWFMSEETGYAHLYTVDIETGQRTPMTAGKYEVFDVQVSRDGAHWYFTSSQVHPGERHFYRLPIAGGVAERITSLPGNNQVILSPDEKTLAIRHATSNRPWELYVQANKPGATPERLTYSLSDEFKSYPWRAPELITIPAQDGARICARLYRPRGEVKPGGKAVIFVHGAGYLQNAHKWWSSYFREYMFHNLLADQGYLVLDLDYRGSAGYGRDWRAAVYRHMGGPDLRDHLDARRFLIEQFEVDSTRIGLYGGSYGGFLTLMALFTEPGKFAAGAALRPVTDWAHYNHPYTASMLNQPQDDSLAYLRSSPIYFAEGLQDPLLICHGMVDTNVHFQDVVRLAQRLIELGKTEWELAVYPVEGHGFETPSSWTDEYRRIYELFEQHLSRSGSSGR